MDSAGGASQAIQCRQPDWHWAHRSGSDGRWRPLSQQNPSSEDRRGSAHMTALVTNKVWRTPISEQCSAVFSVFKGERLGTLDPSRIGQPTSSFCAISVASGRPPAETAPPDKTRSSALPCALALHRAKDDPPPDSDRRPIHIGSHLTHHPTPMASALGNSSSANAGTRPPAALGAGWHRILSRKHTTTQYEHCGRFAKRTAPLSRRNNAAIRRKDRVRGG